MVMAGWGSKAGPSARGLGRRAGGSARAGRLERDPSGRSGSPGRPRACPRDARSHHPASWRHAGGGWQLLEVRQATDISRAGSPPAEPAVAAAVREQYIWSARYIDAPILRDRDAGEGGGLGKAGSGLDERLYYLTDAHMCVMAVVDTGGAAVERYCYDPYGRVMVLNGAADRDEGVGEWSPTPTAFW